MANNWNVDVYQKDKVKGINTSLTANVFDHGKHNLDARAGLSHSTPPASTAANVGATYTYDQKLSTSVDATRHLQSGATNVALTSQAKVWESQDGSAQLRAGAEWSRTYAPGGFASKPSHGAFMSFNKRF